jgi:hypothetical protein
MAENSQADEAERRNGQPAKGERPEEFGRFEALTRKLLRVPKAELDEKRRAPKPSPSAPRT